MLVESGKQRRDSFELGRAGGSGSGSVLGLLAEKYKYEGGTPLMASRGGGFVKGASAGGGSGNFSGEKTTDYSRFVPGGNSGGGLGFLARIDRAGAWW